MQLTKIMALCLLCFIITACQAFECEDLGETPLNSDTVPVVSDENLIEVVFAIEDIAAGEEFTPINVTLVLSPLMFVPENALTSFNEVMAQSAKTDIYAGEIIIMERVNEQ